MKSRWPVLLASLLLLGGSAMATEITFQVSEVNLGQDVATTTGISGSEWLTFGFDMDGASLLLYGPPNPDPFPGGGGDSNGVVEVGANSFQIVFNSPVTDLEVDFWSFVPTNSTMTAFNPSGAAIQVEPNIAVTQGTEVFGGLIKRLVIQAAPQTLCIANLRFEEAPTVPMLSGWSRSVSFVLLLATLAALLTWRSRRARQA